ncbi:MAG: TlpA family protein disulfide reductase [Alphaproteobacteria bacterium]|nr:TlpA family protein disulfide reductase [Alphaproteobacteria bacterium]MCB9795919.1 TlpA family protein disulfide reductase [Alphaproteobacteria bacterium]
MLRYIRDWVVSIAVAVAIFFAIGYLRPGPEIPDAAPDFTLQSLDGDWVSLSEQKGQTVILNFWAEWCGPCRQEIPAFSKFAQENPDIPVYGVATDGTPESLAKAKKALGIDYPVLVADRETLSAYDISTIPTTVVVGPDGQVKDVHVGVMMGWQIDLAAR